MKNIAVIGSGISGLTCAHLLSKSHRVTLFEANDYLGGHTHTVDVAAASGDYSIDTGFIVFNDRTYPHFIELLNKIGVGAQPTEMSFSVHNPDSRFEYNGHTLSTLFSQSANLVSPRFYRFLWEVVKFNRLSKKAIADTDSNEHLTLSQFLSSHGFSAFFSQHYILPMVSAIWSSTLEDAADFPLPFFLRFFENHGLLNLVDRPQWYVVEGGSKSYIPALVADIEEVRLNSPVDEIIRNEAGVVIRSQGKEERFDEVIIACHSDQAVKLLADRSEEESRVLGQLQYRENVAVLHSDESLLPDYKKSWASWNYRLNNASGAMPCLTYNMNILQGINASETFCVTLNPNAPIDDSKVYGRYHYAHPVYNQNAIDAQRQRSLICGKNHTHFCGAYWYNGFHEDGVKSALDVCQRFGVSL